MRESETDTSVESLSFLFDWLADEGESADEGFGLCSFEAGWYGIEGVEGDVG